MKLSEIFLGKAKSPLEPGVFEKLALAAFLAWVGLGADGLSSSCYGPQEIFSELGPHRALAPFLIIAIVITVSALSAGYAYTIEAFPGGGGGYIVATRSLGRYPGLLCGCALILDYALTISISMASGVEAFFSLFPQHHGWAIWVTIAATLALMALNLRGVKESIQVLLPVFIGFLVTHTIAIVAALVSHGSAIGTTLGNSMTAARSAADTLGMGGLLLVLVRAYTAGAGTYTGIEAISNTVPILREPKVATARRAMLYMAISLAFTSGGLLLGYLLFDTQLEKGRTMNAVFLQNLTAGTPFASWFVPLTLLTETALLFIAAQAGYVSGPRAVASMAVDSWVPRWFRHLSDRLVISAGILFIGTGAIVAVLVTWGSVQSLVIVYSFSVFVTFTLSQLGMCVHHLKYRDPGWGFRLSVNAFAFLLSAVVVVAMSWLRPRLGLGTAGVIVGMMVVCTLVRAYYDRVVRKLGRLEVVREQVDAEPPRGAPPAEIDRKAPTAVVLVRGYNGAGLHTVMTVLRLFPNYFKNFVFVSVGDIDYDRFKGEKEVQRLRDSVQTELDKYVAVARKWGFPAESRSALGVDVVEEAVRLCPEVAKEFPRAVFFAGKLAFQQPGILTRLLHEQTGEEIQRRLQFQGLVVIMIPIRVLNPNKA